MKSKILIIALILITFSSCKKDDPVAEKEKIYTTIKGNTYVAKSPVNWESGTYIIYKFDNDSTIDIEERMYSSDGELKNKREGFFKYNHPNLELKIQSILGCDNCFNHFTAIVADDKKSFSYEIWDMGVSENKIIEFNIKP